MLTLRAGSSREGFLEGVGFGGRQDLDGWKRGRRALWKRLGRNEQWGIWILSLEPVDGEVSPAESEA